MYRPDATGQCKRRSIHSGSRRVDRLSFGRVAPPSQARKLASRSDAIHPDLHCEESEAVLYRFDSSAFSEKAEVSRIAERTANPHGSDRNSFVREWEGGEASIVVSLASIAPFPSRSPGTNGLLNPFVATVELLRAQGPIVRFVGRRKPEAKPIRCPRDVWPNFPKGTFRTRSRKLGGRPIGRGAGFGRDASECLALAIPLTMRW